MQNGISCAERSSNLFVVEHQESQLDGLPQRRTLRLARVVECSVRRKNRSFPVVLRVEAVVKCKLVVSLRKIGKIHTI